MHRCVPVRFGKGIIDFLSLWLREDVSAILASLSPSPTPASEGIEPKAPVNETRLNGGAILSEEYPGRESKGCGSRTKSGNLQWLP